MQKINFFSEELKYTIPKKKLLRQWITQTIEKENKTLSEINFIFTTDEKLHKINIEYLNHDDLTDVITFEYNEKGAAIHSDIFISFERIKDNAKTYKQGLTNELHRIIIHGVLHLLGYKDKKSADKTKMSEKENYYLSIRPNSLFSS